MGSTVFRSDHIAGPETASHAPRRRKYIVKLPKAEQQATPWQAAAEVLMLVGEHGLR
jgi:hypothetical protein